MIFDDVLTIKNGRNQKAVENPKGKYPIYGSGGVMGYADDYICAANTVVIGRKGSINNPIFVECPFWNVDTAFGLEAKTEVLIPKYLYYFCKHFNFEKLSKTVTIPSLTKSDLLRIEIDLPEISKQQSIVSQLSKIEDVISLRQQQLQKLDELVKARFVEMFGDPEYNSNHFPIAKLADLCCVGSSKRIYQKEQSSEGIPFLRITDLSARIDNDSETSVLFIPVEKYEELCTNGLVPIAGDILITSRGTLGKCYIVKETDKFYFQDGMISWLSDISEKISSLYISYLFSMDGIQRQIANLQAGSTVAYLSIAMLKKLDIMIPPMVLQQEFEAFVAQVDKLKAAVHEALDESQLLFDSLMEQYFWCE